MAIMWNMSDKIRKQANINIHTDWKEIRAQAVHFVIPC